MNMKIKPKEVQVLEQRWELLKFELEQLVDFYSRCNSVDSVNVINEMQAIMEELTK
ncbi:MAG TPA: hypothetical protein VI423_02960 [Paenisporosarcina sp.]|nr:hypothetical protein [Paenisporosarcina sp.]